MKLKYDNNIITDIGLIFNIIFLELIFNKYMTLFHNFWNISLSEDYYKVQKNLNNKSLLSEWTIANDKNLSIFIVCGVLLEPFEYSLREQWETEATDMSI